MDREELEQLQLERLAGHAEPRVRERPLLPEELRRGLGFNPDDFGSLADLARLPFTTKDDLRDNYPYGLFAVPLREVVRIHASSGTTGTATVVGYTRNDIKTWCEPGRAHPGRRGASPRTT